MTTFSKWTCGGCGMIRYPWAAFRWVAYDLIEKEYEYDGRMYCADCYPGPRHEPHENMRIQTLFPMNVLWLSHNEIPAGQLGHLKYHTIDKHGFSSAWCVYLDRYPRALKDSPNHGPWFIFSLDHGKYIPLQYQPVIKQLSLL